MALRGSAGNGLPSSPGAPGRATGAPDVAKMSSPPLLNRIVSLLGLKNLGAMSNLNQKKPLEAYAIGDRIGIFTLAYLAQDEVIMGDNDKHLNVQVSIYRQHTPRGCDLTVTTVVHNHNWLGRLYMMFVAPAQKVIVRAMLRRYLR